ncbi:hypothetical protein PINS_up020303 [Pythium insidiosum]|nr:hypothetical protein PINS_up020303 [Pythium insidiosum]
MAASQFKRDGEEASTIRQDLELELLEKGDDVCARSKLGDALLDQCIAFNYKRTFAIMSERRVVREYKGVYVKYSIWRQLFTWLLVVYILSVLVADIIRSRDPHQELFSADNLGASLLNLILVVIMVQIALVIRWLISWVIIAELAIYLVTGDIRAVFWQERSISEKKAQARRVIVLILIILEGLTIMAHCYTHHLYPWLVRVQFFDPKRWWLVKPGSRSNSFTYRSKGRLWTDKRATVTYCGGLNDRGEPHGFGIWIDTAFHGEHLRGIWENGVPVGPFTSREHGSGYCFANLRIAYCQDRSESQPHQIYFMPRHSERGNSWGVASVECSVSGGFFRFLPRVQHLTSPDADAPTSAAECLPVLRTPLDIVRATEENPRRKYTLPPSQNSSAPPQSTTQASSFVSRDTEALVFLHGYNCSLDYALNRFAQLLALGDFPSNFHPFIFSWPRREYDGLLPSEVSWM